MREFDGIVIGAGHNGLILQAYAAMAGLDVISIERRDSAGGGLQTVEDPRLPGFRHNTHAFFHRAVDKMPWYRDLDLARHGCRYIEPDRNVVLLLRDGRTLEWWRDFEKTVESFARFSRRDADTLRRWRDDFTPILEKILTPEAQSPPLPKAERERVLGASAEGRLLLDTSRLSPLEFVLREFENPIVQAGLLFFNGLREVDLRAPGFGHHIPALLASPAKAQMAIGGARSLAQSLERAAPTAARSARLASPGASSSNPAGRWASRLPTAKLCAPAASSPPRSIRSRRSSISSRRNISRPTGAMRRRTSATISWRRCSRSTSACASRRATRA